MKLYKIELMWWGRVSQIRHYSAMSAREAYGFATEDGHEVIKMWRARTGQQVFPVP